ncbi:hypothetical protein P7K49_012341 [Saguinus oedipus]|uniref:Uncharacterized protein n=1 Tax=Saguinus oedipus TaxID=9490 RepID=A0ABQ9VT88_SAGOE|nr:hypothetical protein P7K49_012341 [Saguinus oedipus]
MTKTSSGVVVSSIDLFQQGALWDPLRRSWSADALPHYPVFPREAAGFGEVFLGDGACRLRLRGRHYGGRLTDPRRWLAKGFPPCSRSLSPPDRLPADSGAGQPISWSPGGDEASVVLSGAGGRPIGDLARLVLEGRGPPTGAGV